jgi:hypothetical protein
MAAATLTICSPGRTWRVPLNPQGTVIGRHGDCDVVIDSREVSRRHAELFQASEGRWAIKDLGSSNGTFVNGQRIETCMITAEDVVAIGPVSLLLGERLDGPSAAVPASQGPKIIVEDFGTEVFYDKPRIEDCATPPCPQRLAHLEQRLAELADPDAVYPEVCRAVARSLDTAAAIFRVPSGTRPLPRIPEVPAYHFGSSGEDTRASVSHRGPSYQGFRVSHRLLENVRTDDRPLMTKSIFSCDTQVTISLIDEHSPRALICVPIGRGADSIDLLYADVPLDDYLSPGPEEMFAFVQAVARLASSVTAALRSIDNERGPSP